MTSNDRDHRHLRHDRHDDGGDGHDVAKPCSTKLSMRNPANCQSKALESSLTIEWLNSLEAARFLRLSVKALRNMTSNGQVPFYKLGRRNRYRKDELETLLRSQKRGKYGNQV